MTFAIPPPQIFLFQANLSGLPSESFQSFQPSFLSSQLRLILPFCSPKNQVIPPKILRRPLPQAINNERSLHVTLGLNEEVGGRRGLVEKHFNPKA